MDNQEKTTKSIMNVLSLILGIISLLLGAIFIGAPFGIAGVILGIVYLKTNSQVKKGKGLAICGIIFSIIGLGFTVMSSVSLTGYLKETDQIDKYIDKGQYEEAINALNGSSLSEDSKNTYLYKIYVKQEKYDDAALIYLEQIESDNPKDLLSISESKKKNIDDIADKLSSTVKERYDKLCVAIEKAKEDDLKEKEAKKENEEKKEAASKEEKVQETDKSEQTQDDIHGTPIGLGTDIKIDELKAEYEGKTFKIIATFAHTRKDKYKYLFDYYEEDKKIAKSIYVKDESENKDLAFLDNRSSEDNIAVEMIGTLDDSSYDTKFSITSAKQIDKNIAQEKAPVGKYLVGEPILFESGLKVTVTDIGIYQNAYLQYGEAIYFDVEAENTGNETVYFGSANFDIYADDYKVDVSTQISAAILSDDTVNFSGSLAPGRKRKGRGAGYCGNMNNITVLDLQLGAAAISVPIDDLKKGMQNGSTSVETSTDFEQYKIYAGNYKSGYGEDTLTITYEPHGDAFGYVSISYGTPGEKKDLYLDPVGPSDFEDWEYSPIFRYEDGGYNYYLCGFPNDGPLGLDHNSTSHNLDTFFMVED